MNKKQYVSYYLRSQIYQVVNDSRGCSITCSYPKILTKTLREVIEFVDNIDIQQYGILTDMNNRFQELDNLICLPLDYTRRDLSSSGVFVTASLYADFARLNDEMKKSINSYVIITSGFRSPWYQTILFLRYLIYFSFDVQKTLRRVLPAWYSEHCSERLAIDIENKHGLPGFDQPKLFAKTIEYEWLECNADAFNFILSYPENNKQMMGYEPWHWRYTGR